jgi:hypothetical protein
MRAGITFSVFVMFAGILASRGQDVRNDTVFTFDDGTAETGWSILPGNMGWLGNYFPVSPSLSGYIDTLYVWFFNNSGGSQQMLTIDVFGNDQVIKGSTSGFLATSGTWISVPAPNISFSGPFYIMVKWNHLPNPTHYLGYDDNGPNAPQNLERYCDSTGAWSNLVVAGGALPGVFLVRVLASTHPAGFPGLSDSEQPLVYPNPANDKVLVSLQEGINSVKVLTVSGVVLLEFHFNGKKQIMIDLSSIREGVYLMSVSSKSGTTTSTLIIWR